MQFLFLGSIFLIRLLKSEKRIACIMPNCLDCLFLRNNECISSGKSPIRKCINAIISVRIPEMFGDVLEVGYGVNRVFRNSVKKQEGCVWHGIDPRWDRPERNAPRGSVAGIPFADGRFECVYCGQSMEHWHEHGVDLVSGLKEIRRVLKPGGRLYVNVPMLSHGPDMLISGDKEEFVKEFKRAGFSTILVEEWRRFHHPLPPHHAWRREVEAKVVMGSCAVGQLVPSSYILEVIAIR